MKTGAGEKVVQESFQVATAYISHDGSDCASPMWRARAVRASTQTQLEDQSDLHCPQCGTKGSSISFRFGENLQLEPGNPHSLVGNSYVPAQ